MNITIKLLTATAFSSIISLYGCAAPIEVTKGMTVEDVSMVSALTMHGNLISLGRINELPMFEIYETRIQHDARNFEKKYGKGSFMTYSLEPENTQYFLFFQGQLQETMSGAELNQFIEDKKINEQRMIAAANRAAQKKRERAIQEHNRKIDEQKKSAEEARMQRLIAAEEEKRRRIERNTKPVLSTE